MTVEKSNFWSKSLSMFNRDRLFNLSWVWADLRAYFMRLSQDVHTDQWTVLIFDVFRMYKNYFCEIMRPRVLRPRFRWTAWTIVNPALLRTHLFVAWLFTFRRQYIGRISWNLTHNLAFTYLHFRTKVLKDTPLGLRQWYDVPNESIGI